MMNAQTQSIQTLVEKIQLLSARRYAEVEDFVDFLSQRAQSKPSVWRESLDFPVDDPGPWPANLSLRREDMYSDGER